MEYNIIWNIYLYIIFLCIYIYIYCTYIVLINRPPVCSTAASPRPVLLPQTCSLYFIKHLFRNNPLIKMVENVLSSG